MAASGSQPEAVFQRLCGLPADHPFWRNGWMFTRPVFTQLSRQMQDSEAFWTWAQAMPRQLVSYIESAPAAGGEPGAVGSKPIICENEHGDSNRD